MKFSYELLKKLAGKLPEKEAFIGKFNLHAFEAEGLSGDTLEIGIPANRYSDAASHWGIARIAAGIFKGAAKDLAKGKEPKIDRKKTAPEVKVLSKHHTRRYMAKYFEIAKVSQSPDWLKEILLACGLRPINAVVDVMNYVMLEVGQPLHAFDAGLVSGPIQVRLAEKGEEIKTIDGQDIILNVSDLVIADDKGPLAIAGIKGGKRAEINPYTKKIVIEAANFDGVGIYKTARAINLFTDASSRFSHGISPVLVEIGMKRAAELLKEICKAKVGESVDINFTKPHKTVLKFDVKEFNKLTGLDLKEKEALDYLKRAGFEVKGKMVTAPPTRTDIAIHADLAEEIVNLYGYENIPETAPHAQLMPAQEEDGVTLKDNIRNILRGFGMSEVYNYSFVSRKDLTKYADPKWWGAMPLRNPISSDYQYLRPDLFIGLHNNIESNFRFYDEVRMFEIGKIFTESEDKLDERLYLGMAIGFKKGNPFLEMKGLVEQFLKEIGLTDFFFRDEEWEIKYLEEGHSLRVEDGNHRVLGRVGIVKDKANEAYAQFNLGTLLKSDMEEKEYETLPKFPSIMRDLSLLVPKEVRVNQLMEVMENAAPQFLDDVDMLDYYEDPKLKNDGKSLTFRLVFLADDHTLTDEEVGKEMEKIISSLQEKFDVEVR